ncbi:apolipoprotein N-acyltransferase [Clostridia bacterium]|nr:apolipoprotein N-acyltransferase [Clostridia bacterium]
MSFYWLYEFSKVLEFSNFQRALIVTIALLLTCFYLVLFWAVPLIIFGGNLARNAKSVITLSCILVLGEWLQGLVYPLAFPWARFANIVAVANGGFIQTASIFGSLFISFLVLLINGFMMLTVFNAIGRKFSFKNKYFKIVLLIIIADFVLGFMSAVYLSSNSKSESQANILMVQGNYPGLVRWNSEEEMFDTYVQLIEENITEKTDLVLTPEIAIPFDFYEDNKKREKLLDICKDYNVILVLGIWTSDETIDGDYNSVLCLYPDGSYSDVYSKKRLVPFAERIMLKNVIDKIFPSLLNNYTVVEGEKNTIFDTQWNSEIVSSVGSTPVTVNRKMGAIICYESIFPEVVRETVNNGAEFIAFVTDDSWFGTTAALRQHTTHSMLRAVENNVLWLQCSNTGYTCIIDSRGNILKDIALAERETLSMAVTIDVPYNQQNKKTLYNFWGDVPIVIFLVSFLVFSKFAQIKTEFD